MVTTTLLEQRRFDIHHSIPNLPDALQHSRSVLGVRRLSVSDLAVSLPGCILQEPVVVCGEVKSHSHNLGDIATVVLQGVPFTLDTPLCASCFSAGERQKQKLPPRRVADAPLSAYSRSERSTAQGDGGATPSFSRAAKVGLRQPTKSGRKREKLKLQPPAVAAKLGGMSNRRDHPK